MKSRFSWTRWLVGIMVSSLFAAGLFVGCGGNGTSERSSSPSGTGTVIVTGSLLKSNE
jgi:hypothetical protein